MAFRRWASQSYITGRRQCGSRRRGLCYANTSEAEALAGAARYNKHNNLKVRAFGGLLVSLEIYNLPSYVYDL